MSRFETTFAQLSAKKEGAFVPFVTLCDPTFDRSFEIICTLVDNGADALELGFPFSDPLLDGPVIQAANNRALNAGHSTENSFKLLAKVRSKYPEIPISLLLCANLIFAKGLDNFYQRCAEVGVDAVLVADIPLLAKEDYVQAAKKYGVQPVFIVRRMRMKKPFKVWRKAAKAILIWFRVQASPAQKTKAMRRIWIAW